MPQNVKEKAKNEVTEHVSFAPPVRLAPRLGFFPRRFVQPGGVNPAPHPLAVYSPAVGLRRNPADVS